VGVARKKTFFAKITCLFVQQGFRLRENAGKLWEIAGKLRVEIWKTKFSSCSKNTCFFTLKSCKQNRFFDFNPKKVG
jgi:hypothetical protein